MHWLVLESIRLVGVSGNADEAVKKYLSGKLEFTTDVTCTKHESGESHSCDGHCH